MESLKKYAEMKANKQKEMSDLVEKVKTEERAMTPEEDELFNQLEKDIQAINNTVSKINESRKLTEDGDGEDGKESEEKDMKEEEQRALNEEKMFENYVRGIASEERAGELVAGATGAVIPTTIANKIMAKVYDICPILEKSTRYTSKGNLELPYYDESTNAITMAYATEFTALTSKSGEFKKIELTGFLAGALTLVSNSLINNSDFDIVSFVIDAMAKSIARFIEKELLVGTSNKVAGLSGITKKVVTASATAITADEVIKLKDSIKDVYQNNAFFIMSNATRTALRLLKDTTGKYLLNDDITSPFGSVLLGKPVYVSDNMPEISAGKDTIYYGDMSCLSTKFSEDVNIQVLKEKYADSHATGVIGWVEFDAKVSDADGIAKLTQKASA